MRSVLRSGLLMVPLMVFALELLSVPTSELRTGLTLGPQLALLTVMLWGRQKAPQWALQLENELAWPWAMH